MRVTVERGQPGKLHTKQYPRGTSVKTMKEWREQTRLTARRNLLPKADRGSFADDVQRYLKLVRAMPSYEDRKRDLAAWRELYGDSPRSALTSEVIRAQLHRWRTEGPVYRFDRRNKLVKVTGRGLSASTCNHRRTALLHLWSVLEGKDASNPVRTVPPFTEPPPQPRGRNLGAVLAAISTIRSAKQRARAKVLLWTGIRGNSELAKMTPEHLRLEERCCYVPTGKGSTRLRLVPLNEQGIAAWNEFSAVNAWGPYDKGALLNAVRRAGKKAGLPNLRAYDVRHSIATAYLRAGADLADVQELLGHTTPRMTRRYAPFQRAKLDAAARVLDMTTPNFPPTSTGTPRHAVAQSGAMRRSRKKGSAA